MHWCVVVALLGLASLPSALAQCDPAFGLASYYASNMVLQRAPARPRIWGYAPAVGQDVIINLNSGAQTVFVTSYAGPAGRPIWEATLNPITTPGPHSIDIQSGACVVQLTNILVGDVWFCSGQSNMEHRLDNIDNPGPDLDDVVNYPSVRSFHVSNQWSDQPQHDLIAVARNWALPTRANMAGFSAICWLFGRDLFRKYGRPIGLIETNWGGTRVEAWSSPEALSQCFTNVGGANPPNGASQLYNAMIHPLIPLPIYGAIWYQGESNTGNSGQYSCAMQAMVNDWRARWHARSPEMNSAFPFGQVQLAPWRNQDIVDGFPNIRWAQTANVGYTPNSEMNNFFLAVAIDLPDYSSPYGDIHPRYKRQIATRLSLAAQYVAYGETDGGLYQGPLPSTISNVGGGQVRLSYTTPLQFRTTSNGFELCCGASAANTCSAGGRWVNAPFAQGNTQEVFLTNPCGGAETVTGFRYLWRESPCALELCPIYSVQNDLPAPPYLYNGAVLTGQTITL
jgi:sialate O-acetylesterase